MEDNKLIFTWTPGFSYLHAYDCAMMVAISTELNQAVYVIRGANRRMGADQLIIPVKWKETTVETYFSFIAEDGSRCANSIYTGQFTFS
jgi:hypothetical protein